MPSPSSTWASCTPRRGVPQDYSAAVKWYRLAADQGYASAQFNLGIVYTQGPGVAQDHSEAVKWYRWLPTRAMQAQFNLGVMYANGQGVPQDYVLAHMWFNLAAAQGMGSAAESRDTAARQMTPDQLAEAQRLARDWKPPQDQDSEE